MRSISTTAVLVCAVFIAVSTVAAQSPLGEQQVPGDLNSPLFSTPQPNPAPKPLFEELDLLRRNDFAHASLASITVRVLDQHGNFVPNLGASDFHVVVNDTLRAVRLVAPANRIGPAHLPAVLIVLPPNQPEVHYIALHSAIAYFTKQRSEDLPWKVGVFDSNAKFYPFTNKRVELLSSLNAVSNAIEPMQYSNYFYRVKGQSTWLEKAEDAISSMARNDGPRLIIAANPIYDGFYGLNQGVMANDGPQDLINIAGNIGAHIYIHNAGGPDPISIGGDASMSRPIPGRAGAFMQMNGQRGGISATFQLNHQLAQAYAASSYSQSLMRQTAEDTLGGFSNSLDTLAAQMQTDLANVYHLEFDMTGHDQDLGIPRVEVTGTRKNIRMALNDLVPLKATVVQRPAEFALRSVAASVLHMMKEPVLSPDIRISQRVDYFPVRRGRLLAPVLPMTSVVEWMGQGPRPQEISVAESFIDQDLSEPLLERDINAGWQARTLRWSRNGELHPGKYLWLIAVHDANGKILSSARYAFTVANFNDERITFSSLVTGTCRGVPSDSGLQRRPGSGSNAQPGVHLPFDPLVIDDCHLIPQATDTFAKTDTLRALVRIYPDGKLEKERPEVWNARFSLRSTTGTVEATSEMPFAINKGTGISADASIALNNPTITSGQHTLELEIRGPGIKKVEKQSHRVIVESIRN